MNRRAQGSGLCTMRLVHLFLAFLLVVLACAPLVQTQQARAQACAPETEPNDQPELAQTADWHPLPGRQPAIGRSGYRSVAG
ncbi:MAG: hypothetical protein KatS3mg059_1146 [Thermomicrobiales bacterium]|nr:MAG: hypothetical protein KatS3mg059_1146 [Thermomicrobiales bacterium]